MTRKDDHLPKALTPGHPSGQVLPHVLTNKLHALKPLVKIPSSQASSTTQTATATAATKIHKLSDCVRRERANVLYTTQELEDALLKTSRAIVDCQKQIQWGEEAYYEETYAYGNIFQGWDGFIDSREIPLLFAGGGSNSSVSASSAALSRRMPVDYRWFSSSSTSFAKHLQPSAMLASPLCTEQVPIISKKDIIPTIITKTESVESKPLADEATTDEKEETANDDDVKPSPETVQEPEKKSSSKKKDESDKAEQSTAASSNKRKAVAAAQEPVNRRPKRKRR